MKLIITSFEAKCGDSFLIEESVSGKSFLVDCGFKLTYNQKIKKKVDSVDFIILTHSDEDHINGFFPLLDDFPERFHFKKVYVNSPESILNYSTSGPISINQARYLIELLKVKNVQFEGLIKGQRITVCDDDLWLEIISPTQNELNSFNSEYNALPSLEQDASIEISQNLIAPSAADLAKMPDSFPKKASANKSVIANNSSIAFILYFKNKKILFLADSHPEVIVNYLLEKGHTETNKAKFDYIKLSHHGSVKSISLKLINLISCNNFIISTNGGKALSKHPSTETIAKFAIMVDRNESEFINFYFNYPIEDIESTNGPLLTEEERISLQIKYIEFSEITIE